MAGDSKSNIKNAGKRTIEYASGGVVDELMSKRDRAKGPLAARKTIDVTRWGTPEESRADITAIRGAFSDDPVARNIGSKHIRDKVRANRKKKK